MSGETSFDLLTRVRSGDTDALNLLIARHLPRLRQWARGRLPQWARDRGDTEDLVQETLIQTLRRLEHFEPTREGALQAYLRQAVLNRIRDAVRRAQRRPVQAELGEALEDEATSPLEHAIGAEALARYDAALTKLTPADQEAIIGRLELGYDYDELAGVLGKPSAEAARMAVRRAMLKLAELMTHGTP